MLHKRRREFITLFGGVAVDLAPPVPRLPAARSRGTVVVKKMRFG